MRWRRAVEPELAFRVRHRLERWTFEGRPRVLAESFLARMAELQRAAPPRVCSAVLSTSWNRWVTERRWQRRWMPTNRCRFGCPGGAEDSLEHYGYCRQLRAFHARHLQLRIPEGHSWLHGWMLGDTFETKTERLRAGLGAYASYRLYNLQKCGEGIPTDAQSDAFGQYLKEGALGSSVMEKVLEEVWKEEGSRRVRRRRGGDQQELVRPGLRDLLS